MHLGEECGNRVEELLSRVTMYFSAIQNSDHLFVYPETILTAMIFAPGCYLPNN